MEKKKKGKEILSCRDKEREVETISPIAGRKPGEKKRVFLTTDREKGGTFLPQS